MSTSFRVLSGNQIIIDADETLTRNIRVLSLGHDFAGEISIPEFDDTRGIFSVSYNLAKYKISNDTRQSETTPFSDDPYMRAAIHIWALPSLHWNNDARILTVSPETLPEGFWWGPARGGENPHPGYQITFIHYR